MDSLRQAIALRQPNFIGLITVPLRPTLGVLFSRIFLAELREASFRDTTGRFLLPPGSA